jgi:hypothetical protein
MVETESKAVKLALSHCEAWQMGGAAHAGARRRGFSPAVAESSRHALFEGADPQRKDLVVEVRIDGHQPTTLLSMRGRVRIVDGAAQDPDVVRGGPADGVAGLLAGRLGRREALARGVTMTGDLRRLSGLRPVGARLAP